MKKTKQYEIEILCCDICGKDEEAMRRSRIVYCSICNKEVCEDCCLVFITRPSVFICLNHLNLFGGKND